MLYIPFQMNIFSLLPRSRLKSINHAVRKKKKTLWWDEFLVNACIPNRLHWSSAASSLRFRLNYHFRTQKERKKRLSPPSIATPRLTEDFRSKSWDCIWISIAWCSSDRAEIHWIPEILFIMHCMSVMITLSLSLSGCIDLDNLSLGWSPKKWKSRETISDTIQMFNGFSIVHSFGSLVSWAYLVGHEWCKREELPWMLFCFLGQNGTEA